MKRLLDKRPLDALWLIMLAAFVFAIPPTFHADEAMQIYMSRDFITAFIDGSPRALTTEPPYLPDTDQQLRLINGSVNRYSIGLAWWIAGYTLDDLPARPGWQWALDYDTNASEGRVPTNAQLAVARLPSTLFLTLSVVVIFALGWRFGGRLPAYLASGLYALNPVILLNGRRAIQEGSMLCFGLLTILLAALISQRIARQHENGLKSPLHCMERGRLPKEARGEIIILWLALILAGGLTLASKHTGIVFVVAAFGWIGIAALLRLNRRVIAHTAVKLALASLLMVSLFVALSPALWSHPFARLADLLAARAELLDGQVAVEPGAPTSLSQRIESILMQPFMTPAQHYEAAFWASFPVITTDIDRYSASPFSSVPFGVIFGGTLTLAACVGVIVALRQRYAGLLVWLLVIVASLIVNPLPWQRYSLPLFPAATLLAVIGVCESARLLRQFVLKSKQRAQLSPASP